MQPVNYAQIFEEREIFYDLHKSIQRTHHVYFQWFLQSRHTLCGYQRMEGAEQTAAKGNIFRICSLVIPAREKKEIIYLYFFGQFRFARQAT